MRDELDSVCVVSRATGDFVGRVVVDGFVCEPMIFQGLIGIHRIFRRLSPICVGRGSPQTLPPQACLHSPWLGFNHPRGGGVQIKTETLPNRSKPKRFPEHPRTLKT